MKKLCKGCRKPREHVSTYGYCPECEKNNPVVKVFIQCIKQYREWSGNEDWQYDAGEYWLLVPEKMYQMAVSGHSASDVALEFNCSKSNVYQKVRSYCKGNNLETPFRKITKRERKPNGLFCLACGRPLTGRQRKWCSNDDCEGYYALHPEKKPEYIEEQQRLQRIKWAQENVDDLRRDVKNYTDKYPDDKDKRTKAINERLISDAEIHLGILKGTIEPFRVTCSNCGESIETNCNPDLELPSYDGYSKTIGWFCKACKKPLFPPENDNETLRYDMFGNVRLIDISRWRKHVEEAEKKLANLMKQKRTRH